jgi:metal-responsive CopG/Arc/MetJ family transcriptional regulator
MRTALIIEQDLLAKIDEIAGQKHRRAAIIEKALKEFIAREGRKQRSAEPQKPEVKSAAARR